MHAPVAELADSAADVLARVRVRAPRVHCITNTVAQNHTAAVETDAWLAAIAALAGLGVAGEIAGATAAGPGSFATAIIDALHNLDRATLRARIKVT